MYQIEQIQQLHSETNQAGLLANRVHSYADHRNAMREEDMSYDALLALDQGTTNRRITVAQRSKETSPDELFKQIRTTTYRSKKKIKKKTEEAEEEDDECAICLCEFEHRESVKKWPCQHFFHVKCTKVKNERKKNSFFNYH